MKRIFTLIFIVCLVLCLTACGGGDDQSAANEAVLYHAYSNAPYQTLDPRVENGSGVLLMHNVYETLTHYNDQTGEVEPVLATDWEVSEDGLTWVFHLRDDVTFHDGTPMTAETVASSILSTQEKGMGAAYIWDPVVSAEATGDYEVTFTCSYPAPLDLIASASLASYILSEEAQGQPSEWFNDGHDGGTGPYMITQATGDTCVLQAYEDYRGGWNDNQFKNVILKEVPESNARRQMLETGEAQLTSNLTSTDEAALREETDKVTVESFDTFTNIFIMLNHESAPTDNEDFRKALAYAFPYEENISDVLEGNGAISHGLVAPGLWGHDDNIPAYTCDLEKAQEYLDKSGIDPASVNLRLTYATGISEYESWAQLYQVNLKKLGIKLELSPMEWDNQWDIGRATNPDDRQDLFVFAWWPDYASPESWFTSMIRSEDEIFYNLGYIKNPEYDALIEDAILNTSSDRDKAAQDYIELQQQLFDHADIMVLYDRVMTYAYSNAIDGVYENPAYGWCVDYYNITMK